MKIEAPSRGDVICTILKPFIDETTIVSDVQLLQRR